MKYITRLLLIALFISQTLFAQETTGFASVSEAKTMATNILNAAGKKANFQIREAKVQNAMAVLTNGKRYVLYNPDFIDKLTLVTGTKWAAISVLAHEIGHHLKTHTVNGRTIPMASELEADEFSGFVLRKMGATLEEAQAAMKTLASARATRTHPGRDDRLSSIENGWEKADAERGTIALSAPVKNDPVYTPKETITDESPIDSRYILADIHFNADPNAIYHLTTRHNIVRIKGNQLSVVGKLARLRNEDFPYMIYDRNENQVFISASGQIVNSKGGNIGRLVTRS